MATKNLPDVDAINAQITNDIKKAQVNIFNLPEVDRRELEDATFQHFGFGYLDKWIHPKMPGSPPTARIIIPLGDKGAPAYNAILTGTERERVRPIKERTDKPPKWTDKSLTAGHKLVFNPNDLSRSIVGITEGEIDCASLWQAAQRGKKLDPGNDTNTAGLVALGGTGGAKKDLIARLSAMTTKPRVIIMFDGDAPGRERADDLRKMLWDVDVVAVCEFLDDFMPEDDKKSIGGKIDANAILQHFGTDKLFRVFAHVVAKAKKDFKEAELGLQALKSAREATENKLNNRPRELSPEITELISRIKTDVPISRLVDNGYLQHSERGDAHPKGYVCPWCGSGNKSHQTGALEVFDDGAEPYIVCYACGKGGDVFSVYAQVKNMSTRDKEFFELLRTIADEFGVTYDPEIFELPKKKSAAQDFKTGDEAADQWQRDNGVIDKMLYLEICAARDFLRGLTVEQLTVSVARSKKVQRQVALCEVYDFAADAADNFWAVLEDAITDAAAQVKESKSTGEVLPNDVRALAKLHISDLQKDIRQLVTDTKREHKKFCAELEKQKEADKRKRKQKEREDEKSRLNEELNELVTQPQSEDRDARIVEALRQRCEWRLNYHGEPVAIKTTAENAELIFTNDPALMNVIGYDEFQQAEVFLRRPPWKNNSCVGEEWKDEDDAQTRFYLRKTYSEFGDVKTVADALTVFSRKRSFHPVKDWLRKLPQWDGKPRAESIFIDFLGADDTPFTREVTLNWLLAALARIVYPGCPYQTAIILHGAQGIGKSYTLERLGGEWYSVISENVDNNNIYDVIQNVWIGEFREMRGMRKADVNAVKSFIDTAVDNRRKPYGRRPEKVPRHSVFAISVNNDEFLSDVTGNRRFPIIECRRPPGKYVEGLTDEYITQVWAEVKAKFFALFRVDGKMIQDLKVVGKKLELSREAKRQVEAIAQKHMRDDGVINEVTGYLDKPKPPDVIWLALTRDERRKFITDAKIYIGGGKRELERRIRNRTNQKSTIDRDANELFRLLSSLENQNKLYSKTDGEALFIFGTELRQHICAAEIRAECFAPNDRRNNMTRINELLPTIEGWHLGERIQKLDPEYADQKKVFYRDKPTPEETDANADNHNEGTLDTSHDDFIGEPLDLENPPF